MAPPLPILTLREMLTNSNRFLCGVELLTTRGTMAQGKAVRTRNFARDLVSCPRVDWVSITDNAGGNPQLSPMALGKPIMYGGKETVIHLSCKDFNRNGLESEAWQLASEGFHNILTLSGDYPVSGYSGHAKPVFDIDSIGLLTLLREMNEGLGVWPANGTVGQRLESTNFLLGAVTTNFKMNESEVLPQYLKIEKKIQAGAQFIIAQIGFDAAKSHELKTYVERELSSSTPLIGNVFLLNARIASFFRSGRIPGVVISDELDALCQQQARAPDQGEAYFLQLAAKQVALFRGLGYRGVYLGGVESVDQVMRILEAADSYGADTWKTFAREIAFSRPGEFFMYARCPETGLIDPERLNPQYEPSGGARARGERQHVTLSYRMSKWVHDAMFIPGSRAYGVAKKIFSRAPNDKQGPIPLRVLEHASKSLMFGCKDCGDCSLPDIAFLCPESACAKNQRNGPCGGTRDGKCEVHDYDCIWSIAYDRLKHEGRARELLAHAPVIQDQSLRGTSSWANLFLGRDHHGRHDHHLKQDSAALSPAPSEPGGGPEPGDPPAPASGHAQAQIKNQKPPTPAENHA